MPTQTGRRAVFLDRDGVINRSKVQNGKPYAPRQLADFRLLPGVSRAVSDLKSAGFVVIVVTNQPDIGHGLIAESAIDAMHRKLQSKVPVDEVLVCPHRQDANCPCRKPRPGLILEALQHWGIEPGASYMVGDRGSDIVAGQRAGLYTIFVDRGYSETLAMKPDLAVRSLRQAATSILMHKEIRGS
jgi:D-glycero-D-manno-heptose 1,7-bisphosphate phosphatase